MDGQRQLDCVAWSGKAFDLPALKIPLQENVVIEQFMIIMRYDVLEKQFDMIALSATGRYIQLLHWDADHSQFLEQSVHRYLSSIVRVKAKKL